MIEFVKEFLRMGEWKGPKCELFVDAVTMKKRRGLLICQ